MNFAPDSYGTTLREANDCHTPGGSSAGGQFCSKDAGAAAAAGSARSATHNGECQLCGAQQALPRGVLAKHGYNVRWGFFSGTCPGSGYKPFNTHTDRVQKAIEDAESHAAALRKRADEVRQPVAENATTGWVQTTKYVGRQSMTMWEEVPVHEETFGEGRYKKFLVDVPTMTGDTRRRELNLPFSTKTRAEAINHLNEQRAKSFEAEAGQRDAYVKWQRARLANWKETPLVPRAAPAKSTAPRNEHGELTKTETRNGEVITYARRHRYGRQYRWVITNREPVK